MKRDPGSSDASRGERYHDLHSGAQFAYSVSAAYCGQALLQCSWRLSTCTGLPSEFSVHMFRSMRPCHLNAAMFIPGYAENRKARRNGHQLPGVVKSQTRRPKDHLSNLRVVCIFLVMRVCVLPIQDFTVSFWYLLDAFLTKRILTLAQVHWTNAAEAVGRFRRRAAVIE